jgi:hypothetical protein
VSKSAAGASKSVSYEFYITTQKTMMLINTGNLGEYTVPGFGEKFIGVASGGVLEVHGEYRLPWTKLTSTVNKVEYISNVRVSIE